MTTTPSSQVPHTAASHEGGPHDTLQSSPQENIWRRRCRRATQSSTAWILLFLAVITVVFAVLRPVEFAAAGNLRNIGVDSSVLLIVAVGMTFVIATAGIDLSVGSVAIFAGVIAAKTMEAAGDNGGSVLLGLLTATMAGLGWGLINGILITKGNLPPLIVTLGTLGMAMGIALLITNGVDVRSVPMSLVESVGIGRLAGTIPWVVMIAAVIALIGWLVLHATRFGRYTVAIGSNPNGARRVGINVEAHLLKVYALSGALAGFAGFLSLARFATTTIAGHATDNLQAIAAVVLGGTSLFGGIASMLGTVIGVFIPGVLQNGFVILGVQPFWQQVAVGAVLIVAVYVDQLRRRHRGRD